MQNTEKNHTWKCIEKPLITDFFFRFASRKGSWLPRTLIAGCGTFREGDLLNKLGLSHEKIVGIDASFNLLLAANEAYTGAQLLAGNIVNLPFSPDSFDTIISSMVVNHLAQPAYERFVQESTQVLKPDGYLLLHTQTYCWHDKADLRLWASIPSVTQTRQEKTPWGDEVIHFPKPYHDLCEPLIDSGLRIHEVIYHSSLEDGNKKVTVPKRPYWNNFELEFNWMAKRISIIAQKTPLSASEYASEKDFYAMYSDMLRTIKLVALPYELTGGLCT